MKASHVRLAALSDMHPDRVYRLNWLKGCRWHEGRLEILAVFVPEDSSTAIDHLYRWVKATDFPFLILGSEWYRGVMVGKPLGLRRIEIESKKMELRGVTSAGNLNKLDLSSVYDLASEDGNTPVIEITGRVEGTMDLEPHRIYVPLSEVYRSHYFSIPTALPSILGGLISNAFLNPSLEAWIPAGTGWINEELREARIAPTARLTRELTKRLARVVFSRRGSQALHTIHKWIQSSFVAPDKSAKPRKWLPIVPLPYAMATWDASVLQLPNDDEERSQFLVLHIESFDAPEPYRELEIVTPSSSSDSSDGASSYGGGGKILEPDPQDQIDDIDLGWNPAFNPIYVQDVIAKDERAKRRVPRVAKLEDRSSSRGVGGVENVPVAQGSTQSFGRSGRAVAPLVLTDEDASSDPRPGLQDSLRALRQALRMVVQAHHRQGISASARLLPNDSKVYEFRVPASDSTRARNVAVPRQFVIAEIEVGGRYAYVIDPERRSESQPLPLGIVWQTERDGFPSHRALNIGDIHRIVQLIETSARDGHSWIRSIDSQKHLRARGVIHAAGTPPTAALLNRFSNRIASQLMTAVGDVRTIVK